MLENVLKFRFSKKVFVLVGLLVLFFVAVSSSYAIDISLNPNDSINDAVDSVNSGSDNHNTITLNPGVYNKTNDVGNSISNKNVTIIGNGPKGSVIIDARKNNGIFTIDINSIVTFINITFINGYSSSGSAINNTGTINVINCDFKDNTATNGNGGAIHNSGKMNIKDSGFYNNAASTDAGAIFTIGENAYISNSNFTNNTATNYGGAINIGSYSHYATIDGCMFTNNTASSEEGGAVYTISSDHVTVIDSKFYGNSAKGNGGGALYNNAGNYFNVINSTFVNNTSEGYYGGGAIINSYKNAEGLPHGDYFSVINCTFTGNKAINGIFPVGGAITLKSGGHAYIINSHFNDNFADGYAGAIYNNQGANVNHC